MPNSNPEETGSENKTSVLDKLKVSEKIVKFKSEGEEKLVCPYCGSTTFIFDYENGQVICAKCGSVVLEHVIDLRPEWRAFTAEERDARARAGGPLNRLTSEALTTTIDWAMKDASGKELDIKRKLEILKYRKWQQRVRVQTSYERNVIQAMNELSRISSQLGIPKACVDEAMGIYEEVLTKGLVRGRSVEAIVAACLHMACRKIGMPRSLDEIGQYTRASRKEVARCFRLIARELGVKLPLSDPKQYVPRIVEQLKLSGEIIKEALALLDQARKRGLTAGKDPAGLAAAAVYIASLLRGEVRTQKEVAIAAQVTEVTVRNRYKELARELNIKIPIK
ncbi:MAG: transcription initiation factor IIB [Vulcanisaeta sp. AZ3]|jgi:transcription initiation factor TFIIB